MAKRKEKTDLVQVRLLCALVGTETINAGETIETDADEAARLIDIGAAVAV